MRTRERFVHVEHVWDTVVSLHLEGSGALAEAAGDVVSWLHEVDRLLSPFRPDSDLCRWQRGEAASPAVVEVLALSDEMRALTGGAFDDTFGGPRNPVGVVKGWAADGAVALLVSKGVAAAQVNAGGDVRVMGDRTWRLGITDPLDPGVLLDVVEGNELSLATSGTEHRGGHIVTRGEPIVVSASVLGPDLGRADGVATALVAAGDGSRDLLQSLDPDTWSGLLLHVDGTVWASPSWPGEVHGTKAAL